MEFTTIIFTKQSTEQGDYATLKLNRPDALNSFNQKMHEEVKHALKIVREDVNIRALLLYFRVVDRLCCT